MCAWFLVVYGGVCGGVAWCMMVLFSVVLWFVEFCGGVWYCVVVLMLVVIYIEVCGLKKV